MTPSRRIKGPKIIIQNQAIIMVRDRDPRAVADQRPDAKPDEIARPEDDVVPALAALVELVLDPRFLVPAGFPLEMVIHDVQLPT
jgi:hypothetical protein